MDTEVVCLFGTHTNCANKAELDSHNRVRWIPKYVDKNEDYLKPDKSWFPHEIYQEHLRGKYHIFIHTTLQEYCYLGLAHLASYGGTYGETPDVRADFSLTDSIPHNIWRKIGGYEGWKITIHEFQRKPEVYIVKDAEAFLKLLNEIDLSNTLCLDMEQFDETAMSLRFHEKGVYLDRYWRHAYLTNGTKYINTEVYWGNGEPISITTQDLVPHNLAIEVAKFFFLTRKESELVSWKTRM
ncbi:MAG: hypothetical protein U0Z26_04490 [Anaerolineales bacterium]